MQNKVLKSITALLICFMMLIGSIPVSAAADTAEPAPAPAEPESIPQAEPIMSEPSAAEPVPDVSVPQEAPADGTVNEQPSDPAVTDPAVTDPTVPGDVPADVTDNTAGTLLAVGETVMPAFAVQWGMLPMYSGYNGVHQWSIVLENGGYYIYTVTNMYESASFTVSYDEGGEELLRYEASTQPVVLDSLWNPIPGAYVQSYVENNTRCSEIYIPQSFFKDILFTITCGQSVNSLDITDSFGMPAMPDIRGEIATLEEPAAMGGADFTGTVAAMASYPGSDSVYNWGAAYENGNYVFYLVANVYYYQAQMSIGNTPIILVSDNGNVQLGWGNIIASDCKQSVKAGDKNYIKYTVPADKLPADFTISYANTTLTSADIMASSGSVGPVVPDVPDESDQSADNSEFIAEVESAIAVPGCGVGNWCWTYKDGNYFLYIKGDTSNCRADFNLCHDNGGYIAYIGVTPTNGDGSFNCNGTQIPLNKMVQEDNNSVYAKYVIPEGVMPVGFQINANGNVITSEQIKSNGSVSEDYQTAMAIQRKLGSESWAVECGSDGQYHLYIADAPGDIPTVAVTDKLTGEGSSPALSPAAAAEKDGLRYSEYILPALPQWFDISYNGQTKTFGAHPEQAFIDNVTANAGNGWNAVLADDGSCTVYVVSDAEPTAGEFAFENHINGDSISIDESSVKAVFNPETGKYYTQLAVANPSGWFNVTYNGVTKTMGENPDQAIIDSISKKVGSGSWKAEKDADGKIHIYIVDGVGDEVNISAADNAEGNAIDLSSMQIVKQAEYDGARYTEYVVDIDSDWFDISYNGDVMTIGSKIDEDTRPFLEIAKEQTADGAGDGRNSNNISGWGAVKRSDGYHLYVACGKDVYYYRTLLKSTKYDTIIMIDSNSNNIQYGERNIVSEAPINDEVDPETGTRYKEFLIPFDRMPESFDITGNDKVVYLDNNTGIPPIYNGIVIDGGFTDWNALEKIPVEEKRADGSKKEFGVDHMTAVWDGDRVYIYVDTKDKNYSALFTAGPNSNGVYKITTDLNRTLLIQVRGDYTNPVIYGVEGGEVKIDQTGTLTAPHYMEISFPASELPTFHNSISVGIYGDNENVITISDLQGRVDPTPASEVVIDGYYNDWTYYPHTLIQYDTPGIQLDVTKKCDGEQALISHGDEVYGHCVTQHAEHLNEKMGGMWEFNISINNSYIQDPDNPDFKARFLYVGSDGRLHTANEDPAVFAQNAADMNQPYHYYIVPVGDGSCEGMTVEAFEASGHKFGEAYVTHSASQWDIEYKLSVPKLAEHVGLEDATDVKAISSQFHMIGREWVTTAGTSTGAVLGILLCLATVSGTYFFKKKKAMGIK